MSLMTPVMVLIMLATLVSAQNFTFAFEQFNQCIDSSITCSDIRAMGVGCCGLSNHKNYVLSNATQTKIDNCIKTNVLNVCFNVSSQDLYNQQQNFSLIETSLLAQLNTCNSSLSSLLLDYSAAAANCSFYIDGYNTLSASNSYLTTSLNSCLQNQTFISLANQMLQSNDIAELYDYIECSETLNVCDNNYASCSSNLSTTQSLLDSCSTDLTTTQSSLSYYMSQYRTCSMNYISEISLYNQCMNDLTSSTNLYTTCDSALESATQTAFINSAELATCLTNQTYLLESLALSQSNDTQEISDSSVCLGNLNVCTTSLSDTNRLYSICVSSVAAFNETVIQLQNSLNISNIGYLEESNTISYLQNNITDLTAQLNVCINGYSADNTTVASLVLSLANLNTTYYSELATFNTCNSSLYTIQANYSNLQNTYTNEANAYNSCYLGYSNANSTISSLNTQLNLCNIQYNFANASIVSLNGQLNTCQATTTADNVVIASLTSQLNVCISGYSTDNTTVASLVSTLSTLNNTYYSEVSLYNSCLSGYTAANSSISSLTTQLNVCLSGYSSDNTSVASLVSSLASLNTTYYAELSTFNSCNASLYSLQTSYNNEVALYNSCYSSYSSANSTISSLTSQLNTCINGYSADNTTVASLLNSVSSLTATVASLQANITILNAYIAQLQANLTIDNKLLAGTPTPTATATSTSTATATYTSTSTSTSTATATNTYTSTSTSTKTSTNTATATPTSTSTATYTSTNTATPTSSSTATFTSTYTSTSTSTASFTRTRTYTSTSTPTPTPSCVQSASNFNQLMQCDYMYSYYSATNVSTYNLTACQSSSTYAASIGMAAYGNLVQQASAYSAFGTNICGLQVEIANYLILTSLCNLTTITQQIIGSYPYSVAFETLLFPQFAANYGLNNPNQLVGWSYQIDPSYNVYSSWAPVQSKSGGISLEAGYPGTNPLKTQCVKSLSSVYIDGGYFYLPSSYGLFYSTFIQSVEIYNLQMDDYVTACGTASGMTGYSRTIIVLYDCYLTPAGSGTQYLKSLLSSSIVYFQWVEFYQPVAITSYFQQAVNASGTVLAPNMTFIFLDFTTSGDNTTLNMGSIQWSYHFPSLVDIFIIGPAKLSGVINDSYFSKLSACALLNFVGTLQSVGGYCNLPRTTYTPTPTATPTPTPH